MMKNQWKKLIILLLVLAYPLLFIQAETNVGGENSTFKLEQIKQNLSKYQNIMSMKCSNETLWVQQKPSTHPDKGVEICAISNNGTDEISYKTMDPLVEYVIWDEIVYTLEVQKSPSYSIRMAKSELDKTRESQYISLDNYIDETRYFLRKYNSDNPSGKTLYSLPTIKGYPKPVDLPGEMFVTLNEIILVYGFLVEDSYCNLRIDRYPLNTQNAPFSIVIPKISRNSGPRGFYIKDNFLYLKRINKDLEYKTIYDLVKINIDTGEVIVCLTKDNLISYGIDDTINVFYYITGEVEYLEKTKDIITKGIYLNYVPFDNMTEMPKKEKLPFMVFYGIKWDDIQNSFVVSLPNDARNDQFPNGGFLKINK